MIREIKESKIMSIELKYRINNTNDTQDRSWGIAFLKGIKNKEGIVEGGRFELDLKSTSSNYGADVEKAYYDPMTRPNNISIPYRKQKISGYWNDDKETDYIQFVKNNTKLIYIESKVIKKYKDNPIHRGNIPLPRTRQTKGYYGYTIEESKKIWNSYIEIPKSEVEVWEFNQRNRTWNKV